MVAVRTRNNPFTRSGNHDPKLALLRRADTERDVRSSLRGLERHRFSFGEPKPITLPRLAFLEIPIREDDR